MITRIVLITGTVAFVAWLTWAPSIGRTIRARRKGVRP